MREIAANDMLLRSVVDGRQQDESKVYIAGFKDVAHEPPSISGHQRSTFNVNAMNADRVSSSIHNRA